MDLETLQRIIDDKDIMISFQDEMIGAWNTVRDLELFVAILNKDEESFKKAYCRLLNLTPHRYDLIKAVGKLGWSYCMGTTVKGTNCKQPTHFCPGIPRELNDILCGHHKNSGCKLRDGLRW